MIEAGTLLNVGAGLALAALGLFGATSRGPSARVRQAFDALFVTSVAFILASLVVGLTP